MNDPRVRHTLELLRSGELAARYAKLVSRSAHPGGGLVLLNYTPECQFARAWDDVTTVCRGLVVDTRTWEVAAWPFPKFFNVGERPDTALEALPREPFAVYEKLDGSLGVLYRHGGAVHLATRGSFASDQARRGTDLLRRLRDLDRLPEELTLLFEIIYPENRSVVRYDFAGLVLLAAYDRFTGRELPWPEVAEWAARLGCRTPQVYEFATPADVAANCAALPGDVEGYVVRFASGQRVKLKGAAYLTLHKLIWGLSENRILEALTTGTFADLLREVPEEFRPEVERMAAAFRQEAAAFEAEARRLFALAPQGADRKTFALWVQAHAPVRYRGPLFNLRDGRPLNWFQLMQRE